MTEPSPDVSNDSFAPSDIKTLRKALPDVEIEHLSEVDSTNNRALWRIESQPDITFPFLIVADRQTSGRGRQRNTWWSSTGALTFSLALDSKRAQLPTKLWPQVGLVAGLAVCEALEPLAPGASFQVKWPNDVYLCGKKICGILTESPSARSNSLVIGIGINVNNSAAEAPGVLPQTAITLSDVTGERISLVTVLCSVVSGLLARLAVLASGIPDLTEEWQARCFLDGRAIRLETDTTTAEGICRGIDPQGALLLESEGGVKCFVSGTVILID